MKIVIFINLILLGFIFGCSGQDKVISQEEFLSHFKSSLVEQGVEVEQRAESKSNVIKDKMVIPFAVSPSEKHPDGISVFVFDSSKEAKKAMREAQISVTTETRVREYRNKNIVVFYYMNDIILPKYEKEVEKAVKSLK